jgi:S-adenosylmethionine:tRNA ribosyltransferase-isomerase
VRITDFDYHLPPGLVVRTPPEVRDAGRLLVVYRRERKIEHRKVLELAALLKGRTIYANDAKVERCRIEVSLPPKGIVVECILLRRLSATRWEAFSKVPKFYGSDAVLRVVDGPAFRVVARDNADHSKAVFEFETPINLEVSGTYPLPPCAERPSGIVDWSRYETIYAFVEGSRARPTAGWCLSREIVAEIGDRMQFLTLDVALESYDAPTQQELDTRRGHLERYNVATPVTDWGGVAVGSTSLRAIESYGETGIVAGETDLFIAPGHEFRLKGGLLSNLHFPMESVLVMACAFGGTDLILRAHREAAEKGYRFGDWGDSMLILDE